MCFLVFLQDRRRERLDNRLAHRERHAGLVLESHFTQTRNSFQDTDSSSAEFPERSTEPALHPLILTRFYGRLQLFCFACFLK